MFIQATMKFDDGIMQQSADSNSTESNIPKNQSVTKERPKKGRKSIDEMRENFSKLLMDVWLDVRNLKVNCLIIYYFVLIDNIPDGKSHFVRSISLSSK
jgi:hypothetical protein